MRIGRKIAGIALSSLVVALVFPTGVWGAAEAAASERHVITIKDGVGDVWDCPSSCVAAGAVPTADVTRFHVRHGRANVRISLVFSDLRRQDQQDYWVVIRTKGLERLALVSAWRQHWDGQHWMYNGEGCDARKRGMTHRIRYGVDTVTMVVPRALLHHPRWIHVGAVNQMWPDDAQEALFEDNPMNDGVVGLSPPLSPRLFRMAA